jgi:hypothetical protein
MPKAKTKSAPKAATPDPKPVAAKGGTKVIYRPLAYPNGQFDPAVVKWNGVMFYANVPVMLDPAKHFVLTPYMEIVNVDGINKSIERERKVSMIELAKSNPSFQVEGCPRATVKKSSRVVPPAGATWDEANDREMVEAVEWDKPSGGARWTTESETEALI